MQNEVFTSLFSNNVTPDRIHEKESIARFKTGFSEYFFNLLRYWTKTWCAAIYPILVFPLNKYY